MYDDGFVVINYTLNFISSSFFIINASSSTINTCRRAPRAGSSKDHHPASFHRRTTTVPSAYSSPPTTTRRARQGHTNLIGLNNLAGARTPSKPATARGYPTSQDRAGHRDQQLLAAPAVSSRLILVLGYSAFRHRKQHSVHLFPVCTCDHLVVVCDQAQSLEPGHKSVGCPKGRSVDENEKFSARWWRCCIRRQRQTQKSI